MAEVILKNVFKTFDKTIVVKGFYLDIQDGEFLVLVGPSGCGKSTTLRLIAGLETITSGEIYIGDRLVNHLHPRDRAISMVFQNYALYPQMTVYENMSFSLKMHKVPKEEIDKIVKQTADLLRIDQLLGRKPGQLSGGQRQRVALGRSIVRDPQVFLFDEPLSNLDAKLRVQTRTEISKLHQRLQTTFVYVTHDQTEAMTMGDRIVIMKDGIIQQVGSPREIYQTPANAFVAGFIGRANIILGIIESKEVESTIVEVEGVEYRVPRATEREIGETIEMVLRPESITLGVEEFETQVIKSVFMGETHEYEVKWGDKTLQVCESNPFGKPSYGVGDKLMLGFDEKALHIL